eukprot:tig00000670_g3044.t1
MIIRTGSPRELIPPPQLLPPSPECFAYAIRPHVRLVLGKHSVSTGDASGTEPAWGDALELPLPPEEPSSPATHPDADSNGDTGAKQNAQGAPELMTEMRDVMWAGVVEFFLGSATFALPRSARAEPIAATATLWDLRGERQVGELRVALERLPPKAALPPPASPPPPQLTARRSSETSTSRTRQCVPGAVPRAAASRAASAQHPPAGGCSAATAAAGCALVPAPRAMQAVATPAGGVQVVEGPAARRLHITGAPPRARRRQGAARRATGRQRWRRRGSRRASASSPPSHSAATAPRPSSPARPLLALRRRPVRLAEEERTIEPRRGAGHTAQRQAQGPGKLNCKKRS